ncbi:MAG: DUF6712 family protein [Balneolaceae bacterium]|nr:DUF6712 family protein [Balneolaceae bacterium]
MTPILNDTAQIRNFLSVNVNVDFDTLSPHIDNALTEFLSDPWLGNTIVSDIETNVNTVTGIYPTLVELTQRCLTYFSVLKALPFIEVNIGDQGITRTESDHTKSAYRGQVARIEKQLKTDANNSLEKLLNFLEANKATYTLWTDAPGYIENSNYFFVDAKDFAKYYHLKHGRLTYNKLLPSMRYVTEFMIKAETGSDQFDDFFAKKTATNNTSYYKEAYKLLKNALAYLTVSNALVDGWIEFTENGVQFTEQTEDIQKFSSADGEKIASKIRKTEQMGQSYLSKLVEYMNNNLDEFPPFRDDTDITKVEGDNFTGVGQIKGFFGA